MIIHPTVIVSTNSGLNQVMHDGSTKQQLSKESIDVHLALPGKQLNLVKWVYESLTLFKIMKRCSRAFAEYSIVASGDTATRLCNAQASSDYNVRYVSGKLDEPVGIIHFLFEKKDW